jgi:Flp pilus assembly protein TadG
MTRRRIRGNDRGSVTLETIILIPALFLLVNMALLCGRVMLANAAVRQAVEASARAGSVARNSNAAQLWGKATFAAFTTPSDIVGNMLNGNSLRCTSTPVDPDATPFFTSPGPASIGAGSFYTFKGTCVVSVTWLPGFTQSLTVTYTASSPVDPFRCHGAPGRPC